MPLLHTILQTVVCMLFIPGILQALDHTTLTPGDPCAWSPAADTLRTGELDRITIRSTRIDEPVRFQPVRVEPFGLDDLSLHAGESIGSLLSRSSLFVRDNGPGGMTLPSQRGLSPGQTQVLWEGFPINSLSLGQSDLSLLPAVLFQSVEVSPGTPSSSFGGASLGGNLYLTSRSGRRTEAGGRKEWFSGSLGAGAFGKRTGSVHVSNIGKRQTLSATLFGSMAENDFPYSDYRDGRKRRRENNTGSTGHLMINGERELKNGSLSSQLWAWDRMEEIPGTVLTSSPDTRQRDLGIRWNSRWSGAVGHWRITPRLFLERYQFTYREPSSSIDSRLLSDRLLTSVEAELPTTGTVRWTGGVSGGLERVDTNNYPDTKHRLRAAAWIRPDITTAGERLRLTPALRMDAYSDFSQVLSPSLGINWELVPDRLHLRGLASRDFNPPTFNDLHWQPGGNPNLKPERSIKTEGGFYWLPDWAGIRTVEWTAYRIWLNQGIYWSPVNGSIWSPENVEELHARGIETRMEAEWFAGPTRLQFNAAADLRKAEIGAARFPGDQAPGRQLRYVPEWSFRGEIRAETGPFTLLTDYRWTDRRWITADHTSYLPPHQIVNLAFLWKREWRLFTGQMQLSVRNLLDKSYEIIRWYPMPGRHLEFTLRLGLPVRTGS